MEDAVACDICAEKFSSGEHDPLVLQCGHCFCRSCLINMSSGRAFQCPNCRMHQNDIDINSLPVNFKLLGLATEPITSQHGSCTKHGDELTYWCKTCELSLCGFCIYADHPREHELVKRKGFLQQKRRLLESRFQKWKNEVEINHYNKMKMILRQLRNFYISKDSFAEAKKDITNLLAENTSDFTAESLQDLESKLNSLMTKAEILACKPEEVQEQACIAQPTAAQESSINEGEEQEQACIAQPTVAQESTINEGEEEEQACIAQATAAQDSTSNEGEEQEQAFIAQPTPTQDSMIIEVEESSHCIQNGNGQNGMLLWQNGKLLMTAFCKDAIQCDPVFKLPKEVFLEVSIKDTCLGIIIIQPWYQLRRAHQFAYLCLGTLGISYTGSCFFRVDNKGQPQEVLSGGWYVATDDNPTCKDLLRDLEWGGAAIREAQEGLVMAFATLREPRLDIVNDASGFGICTRGARGGTFKCPFANVVSGLDVAKRVVEHDSMREVIISRCGGVLLDLDD